MAKSSRDPLLGTVRAVLSVGMIGAIVVTATTLASVPLTLLWRARILAEIGRRGAITLPPDFIWVICGICVLIALTASLGACPWLQAAEVQQVWANYKTGRDTRAWSRVWTLAVLIAFANRRIS